MVTLEKNIEIPEKQKIAKYPYDVLELGDSFPVTIGRMGRYSPFQILTEGRSRSLNLCLKLLRPPPLGFLLGLSESCNAGSLD